MPTQAEFDALIQQIKDSASAEAQEAIVKVERAVRKSVAEAIAPFEALVAELKAEIAALKDQQQNTADLEKIYNGLTEINQAVSGIITLDPEEPTPESTPEGF